MSPEQMQTAVTDLINSNPEALPAAMAAELNISEFDVVRHLPKEMVTLIDASHYLKILEELPGWGDVLTVLDIQGNIFEMAGPFPKGTCKFGYYNLKGSAPFLGHLKPDGVSGIALVRKPFHGVPTCSVQFFNADGSTLFKVYIRRNRDKSFIAEQLEQFEGLTKLAE